MRPDLYDCFNEEGERIQEDWDISDSCREGYAGMNPPCGGCGECVAAQVTFYGGYLRKVSLATRLWRDFWNWCHSFDEDVFRQVCLWSPRRKNQF